jgi:acyl-CoA synthetase (AMP-forming)/AMP-acid ligase II
LPVAAQGQAGRRPGPAGDRGGWFHPDDLGCATRTATAQLLDRAKDIVISGSENIYTIEVENALMSRPDVAVMVQG